MANVTSIEVIAGGAPAHVTVEDQDGDALPPANLTWAPVAGVTVTPDATGFLFAAAAGTVPAALSTEATYSGPLATEPVVGPPLAVNIGVGVTSLEYTSP